MVPGVAAVILNERNELLLQEKKNEPWSLPAGMIEPGETPREAIVREVAEETGLRIEPTRLLGVFGGKDFSYTYPNGHQVEYTIILMLCECREDLAGQIIIDGETVSTKYFSKKSMPDLVLPYPVSVLYNELSQSLIT